MRINIIPVQELADQHLFAEFREIKMLPKMFLKSYNTPTGIQFNRIKQSYTLNAGHGYFFYNKFKYIERRFKELSEEVLARGYKTASFDFDLSKIPVAFFNDYTPTFEEQQVNVERILLRINDKPNWYKFHSKVIDWNRFYIRYI